MQKSVEILSEQPLKIPAGGSSELRVRAGWLAGEFEFELADAPAGIALGKVSRRDKEVVAVLSGDAEKARPGVKGNLIVNVFHTATFTGTDGKKRTERAYLIGPLPAIPFEIVKRS